MFPVQFYFSFEYSLKYVKLKDAPGVKSTEERIFKGQFH